MSRVCFFWQVTALKAFAANPHFLLIIRDILISFWLLPGAMAAWRKKMKKTTVTRMKW